jgi:hypothetical protein
MLCDNSASDELSPAPIFSTSSGMAQQMALGEPWLE